MPDSPQEQTQQLTGDLSELGLQLGKVSSILGEAAKRLESTARTLSGVSGEVKKATDETNKYKSSIEDTSKKMDDVNKKTKEHKKQVEELKGEIRKTTIQVATLVGTFGTLARSPAAALEKIHKMFEQSNKTAAEFQNAVYMGAQRFDAYSRGLRSSEQSLKLYRSTIEDIAKVAEISTPEAENLFSTLMSGIKGVRTDEAVKAFSELSKSVIKTGLSMKEATKMAEGMAPAMNKFAEVRNLIQEGNYREAKEWADVLYMAGQMSEAEHESFAFMANQQRLGGGKIETITEGREVAASFRREQVAAGERAFQQNLAESQNFFVENLRKAGTALEEFALQHVGILASANVLGAGLQQISGLTAASAPMVAGMATSRLGSAFGSFFTGGGLKGALAAGATNAAPVFVTNPGLQNFSVKGLKESIGGGIFSGKFGTGMIGKTLGIGGLLAAAGFTVSEGIKEFQDPRNKNKTNSYKLMRGAGSVGTYAALGAGIGSVIPGLGTLVGAGVGAGAGALLGTKYGRQTFDYLAESLGYTGDIKEEQDNITESVKKTNQQLENMNKESKSNVGLLQEAKRETEATRFAAEKAAEAYGKMGDVASQFIGSAEEAALNYQKQAQFIELSKVQTLATIEIQKKQAQEAKEAYDADRENLSKKVKYLMAVSSVMQEQAKLRELDAKAIQTEIKSRTHVIEQVQKLTQQNVELTAAERERDTAARLGLGVSYQDTKRLIAAHIENKQALMEEVKIYNQYARQLEMEGKLGEAAEMRYRARQAEIKLVQEENKILQEAKAIREGYLDAMKAQVFGAGGFAKLIPKLGEGNQFFARTAAVGAVLSENEFRSGFRGQEAPSKYGLSGLQVQPGFQRTMDMMYKDQPLGALVGWGPGQYAMQQPGVAGAMMEGSMMGKGGVASLKMDIQDQTKETKNVSKVLNDTLGNASAGNAIRVIGAGGVAASVPMPRNTEPGPGGSEFQYPLRRYSKDPGSNANAVLNQKKEKPKSPYMSVGEYEERYKKDYEELSNTLISKTSYNTRKERFIDEGRYKNKLFKLTGHSDIPERQIKDYRDIDLYKMISQRKKITVPQAMEDYKGHVKDLRNFAAASLRSKDEGMFLNKDFEKFVKTGEMPGFNRRPGKLRSIEGEDGKYLNPFGSGVLNFPTGAKSFKTVGDVSLNGELKIVFINNSGVEIASTSVPAENLRSSTPASGAYKRQ